MRQNVYAEVTELFEIALKNWFAKFLVENGITKNGERLFRIAISSDGIQSVQLLCGKVWLHKKFVSGPHAINWLPCI